MAFTFQAAAVGTAAGSGATLDTSTSLDVAAGDLLVFLTSWENASTGGADTTTVSVAKNSGTPTNAGTFDSDARATRLASGEYNITLHGGYKLAAEADASATFRMTTSAAMIERRFIVLQFRPDSGEAAEKDDFSAANGASGTANSGNITTTGTDEVVVGAAYEWGGGSSASEQINGVTATEPSGSPVGTRASAWYRILTSTFAGGAATCTGMADWLCAVLAFKAVTNTGPGTPTLSPSDGAVHVSPTTTLELNGFIENVQAGTGDISIYRASDDTLIEAIDVTDTGQVTFATTTVTATLTSPLAANTQYYVLIDSTAVESAVDSEPWSGFASEDDWTFTTAVGPGVFSKAGSFSSGTGALDSTVEVTGIGFTPKLVLFWWSGQTSSTDAAGSATHRRGFGYASSPSVRGVVSSQSEDASASADCDSTHRTDACVATLSIGGAIDGLLDLSVMHADGFTLVVDDVMPNSLRVHYLAIGGDDIEAVTAGVLTEPGATGNQDITVTGFESSAADQAVLFLSAMIGADPPGTAVDSSAMFGVAAGATPTNYVWAGGSNNGATTIQAASYCRSGECIATLSATIAATDARASVSAWLTDGFRLNWAERAGSRRVLWVAIKGGQWHAGDLLTQTDTTTDIVESGFGFEPAGALFVSHCKAESSSDTFQDDDEWSMGAFSDASTERAMAVIDDDGAADSECTTAVEHDNVYVNLSLSDAVEGAMQVISVESGGFTCEMTDADPSQAFVWYLAFGASAGAGSVETGLAAETDAAQATTLAKQLVTGLGAETDAAQAVTLSRTLAAGLSSETDTALSVALTKTVGLATESDSAQALTLARQAITGRADETDAATALTLSRAIATGQASETDAAQALTLAKQLVTGLALETDAALAPATLVRAVATAAATETDSAFACTLAKQLTAVTAVEADTAEAPGLSAGFAVGTATETDSSVACTLTKQLSAGVAVETDAAQAVTAFKTVATGVAAETDTAASPGLVGGTAVGRADEIDEAVGRTLEKRLQAGTATETDVALPLDLTSGLSTGVAAETDSAIARAVTKALATSAAVESGEALAPTLSRQLSTLPSVETAVALSLALTRALATGEALETDTGAALSFALFVRPAVETDEAPDLVFGNGLPALPPRTGAWIKAATPGTGAWVKAPSPGTSGWTKAPTPSTGAWSKH